jgi:hypothetical protein
MSLNHKDLESAKNLNNSSTTVNQTKIKKNLTFNILPMDHQTTDFVFNKLLN